MKILIFLCIGGFIAGGGGLISMPILMISGVPTHIAHLEPINLVVHLDVHQVHTNTLKVGLLIMTF